MNILNVVIGQLTNQIWPSEILQSTNYCVLTSPDPPLPLFPLFFFLQEWVEGLGTRLAHNEPLPQLHMDKAGVTSDIQRVAGEAADERRKRLFSTLRTKLISPKSFSKDSDTMWRFPWKLHPLWLVASHGHTPHCGLCMGWTAHSLPSTLPLA